MDNSKIVIWGLVAVIIILLVALIPMVPHTTKQDTNITFASGLELNEGELIQIKLADANGNGIANQTLNVTVSGDMDSYSGVTDDNGICTLNLDEGKYEITAYYGGNKSYNENKITEYLTINKATTKSISQEQTSTASHTSKYSSDGTIYPEYGPEVDARGVTREYAIANDWHYIPQTIDGQDAGLYVPYDAVAGCYHT